MKAIRTTKPFMAWTKCIDEKELPAIMQRVPFSHQFFQQRDFLRAGFANAFLHAPILDIFSPSGV